MFLDSVTNPTNGTDVALNERAAATEENSPRLASWIATRDGEYGFGTTPEEVRDANSPTAPATVK